MKQALKIAGFIIAFIICSVIVLALLVDANMFKPRITALAQQQGIAVTMRGDLRWAFWPSIGLAVNDVSIASTETPSAVIADVKKASFLIAFIPLMRGDFQVKHVLVDGAIINLAIDEQGKGNWEALTAAQDKQTANQPHKKTGSSVTSNDLQLSIEKISLQNSAVNFTDQRKGQRIQLSDIDLKVNDVNTNNNPFDMDFSWIAQISAAHGTQKPTVVKAKMQNRIAVNSRFSSIVLTDSNIKLEFNANSAAAVALDYSLTIEKLDDNLRYQGKFALANTNAKKLLAALATELKTANEKALTSVSLSADVSGDSRQTALKNLNLTLDNTTLKGDVSVNDFASQDINANLQGDSIILDDYLAPPVPQTPEAIKAAESVATPLPLELLRSLNLTLKATFAKMIFSQLTLEKIQLDVSAKDGTIQQQLSANAYSGNIHEKMTMEAREKTATVQVETILNGIQIAPILKDKKFDKSVNLSGAIEANAKVQGSGATSTQLINSLAGNANFSGVQIRLAPINIEQQFCQMINLVSKTEAPQKTWNAYTELRELSGKIAIADRVIKVESVNAGVEKLLLSTQGSINLNTGAYDFILPLKLVRDAQDTPTSITTSAQGCVVNSNYWAERSMSLLRCKGAYAEINPAKDCRPDKDMLTAVVKDFAEYKLRAKYGEKVDAKKTELLKKLDDKLGGESNTENAKALLKNIFKKKDEQPKTDE